MGLDFFDVPPFANILVDLQFDSLWEKNKVSVSKRCMNSFLILMYIIKIKLHCNVHKMKFFSAAFVANCKSFSNHESK